MPASSLPICSRWPASIAWPREIDRRIQGVESLLFQISGLRLAEKSSCDEANETIDDITRKNSADTPTNSNANHQFPTSQEPPTTRTGCPPPGRSAFAAPFFESLTNT